MMNREENVSFSNSVIQVLYAIPDFFNHVCQLSHNDQYVMKIKEMLIEIENLNAPVQTSNHVRDLGLSSIS